MSNPLTVPSEEPRVLPAQLPVWLHPRTLVPVALALVAGIALLLWQYSKSEKARAESDLLLESKPGAQTWAQLIRDYPGQPATALAILESAADASSKKDFRQASSLYEKFARDFPSHPLASAARFAQANQLSAAGDRAAAQTLYLRIMTTQPTDPFRSGSAVGLARIQIQENRPEAARQALNEIIAANTGSAFVSEARSLLESLPPPPLSQAPAK
jgi:TolA-binding protein